jgi:hypothetical protein
LRNLSTVAGLRNSTDYPLDEMIVAEEDREKDDLEPRPADDAPADDAPADDETPR